MVSDNNPLEALAGRDQEESVWFSWRTATDKLGFTVRADVRTCHELWRRLKRSIVSFEIWDNQTRVLVKWTKEGGNV